MGLPCSSLCPFVVWTVAMFHLPCWVVVFVVSGLVVWSPWLRVVSTSFVVVDRGTLPRSQKLSRPLLAVPG